MTTSVRLGQPAWRCSILISGYMTAGEDSFLKRANPMAGGMALKMVGSQPRPMSMHGNLNSKQSGLAPSEDRGM